MKMACWVFATDNVGFGFAWAFWNGRDPMLKERLFGWPARREITARTSKSNIFISMRRRRTRTSNRSTSIPKRSFPISDSSTRTPAAGETTTSSNCSTAVSSKKNRYFDILAEYAKAGPHDLLIRLSVTNCGPEAAPLWVLPTLWCRNTWSWGCTFDGFWSTVNRVHRFRLGVIVKTDLAVGYRIPQQSDVFGFWCPDQNELVQVRFEVEPPVLLRILGNVLKIQDGLFGRRRFRGGRLRT